MFITSGVGKELAPLAKVRFFIKLATAQYQMPIVRLVVPIVWIGAITATKFDFTFNHFLCHDTHLLRLQTDHDSIGRTWLYLHCNDAHRTNQQPTQTIVRGVVLLVASSMLRCNAWWYVPGRAFSRQHTHLPGFPCNLQDKAPSGLQTRPYASPSIWGSPMMNEFSLACCSLIFAIVPCTSFEMPARSTDSSCEMTGLLPLAVSQ